MNILLKKVDFFLKSYYSKSDLPDRMKFVYPSVYDNLKELQEKTKGCIVYTDMFRTPTESLDAVKRKGKLASLPGYSGHNYGVSFDFAVDKTLNNMVKEKLIDKNKKRGEKLIDFYKMAKECCWVRHTTEEWHMNCLGNVLTVSEWISLNYGSMFNINVKEVQDLLNKLGYNCGVADGIFGKKTLSAMNSFQKSCGISITNMPDEKTKRILVIFNSEVVLD